MYILNSLELQVSLSLSPLLFMKTFKKQLKIKAGLLGYLKFPDCSFEACYKRETLKYASGGAAFGISF